MKTQKKKVFVEIGVCEFDTLEPLLENGWEGYFVEPIKKYADKITHNMTNCAISSYNGTMEMYMSNGLDGGWSKGISLSLIHI